MISARNWNLVLALCVAGCTGSSTTETRPERTAPAGKPQERGAIFGYLLERYDANGDGAIDPAEYSNQPGAFQRLDRQADGRLTEADFRPAGRRLLGLSPAEARRLRSLHLIAWYFQGPQAEEADRHRVDWDEVAQSFRSYDGDGNGRIGRTEFEALADERAAFGRQPAGRWAGLLEVETTDPWERTLGAIDLDDDGFLTVAEVSAFYAAQAELGVWEFDPSGGLGPVRSLVGEVAPDFDLPGLAGQSGASLSEFAGERPVALIFGSYT